MRKWNATRALELVQQEKITNLVGVPTMTYELVNSPEFGRFDTSSLQGVGGGGSAFSAPMIKRVEDKFKNARAGTGYGLTETNAVTVVMPAPIFPMRPTSCGLPVAHIDVCIISEDGKVLPPGEMGEICIRGAGIMREYWNKPDKTAEVFHFDAEGRLWFKSGDLGTVDKDGFVYITDRAKDIIIRGGENISCAEVEGALFEHASVAEVAAIGVPHPNLGEVVAAVLCIKQGEKVPSVEELAKHSSSRLASFKVPAEYHFWHEENLPRGATGKIQKREIREVLKDKREPKSKL
jgi:long-chain acyl-CoA synthetase